MNRKSFWRRGLLLLMSLLVVLAMTATTAFALTLSKIGTIPGSGLTLLHTGVTLSSSTLNLDAGQTATLTATVTPFAISTAVTWSSDTPSVATVNSNGLVTAIASGTANITASDGGYTSAPCVVTVTEATAVTSTELPPGYAGVPTVNSAVTDTSGSTVIITFNEEMSNPPSGSAGFTVTMNGVGDTVTSNALESNTAKLDLTLTTAVQYGDTVTIAYAGNSMKSYNSLKGNVNGVTTYSYYMLLPFSGMAVTNNVPSYNSNTTMALPIWVSLNTNTLNLTIGSTATLAASTATLAGATNAPVTWSTNNSYTATVNAGLVTANEPGTAIITATSASGNTAACTVTVAGEVTMAAYGVALSPNTLNLTVGATSTLTATVSPSASNSPVNWSSDNPFVATVNNGLVTAVAPGTANITAITEYVPSTATCAVTVTAATGVAPVVPPHSQGIQVYVNGQLVPMDVSPIIDKGHLLVQMRPIFEALGAIVQWDAATPTAPATITATKGDTVITLTIGSTTAYKNGNPVTLAVAPRIIKDHTFVPVAFISKAFGYQVKWDAADREVKITSS